LNSAISLADNQLMSETTATLASWIGWYSNPTLAESVAATVRVSGGHLEITDNRDINRGHWRLEELCHPRFAWSHDTWSICARSAPDARLILEDASAYNVLRGHAPQLRALQPVWMRLITGGSMRENYMVPTISTAIVIGVLYALAKLIDLL
jgi:hypothetical protein